MRTLLGWIASSSRMCVANFPGLVAKSEKLFAFVAKVSPTEYVGVSEMFGDAFGPISQTHWEHPGFTLIEDVDDNVCKLMFMRVKI